MAEEGPDIRAREGNRTEAPRMAGDRRPPRREPKGEKNEGAGSEPRRRERSDRRGASPRPRIPLCRAQREGEARATMETSHSGLVPARTSD